MGDGSGVRSDELEVAGRILIDGAWRDGDLSARLEVFNPATGGRIGSIPAGGAAEIDEAVAAARRAFESKVWSGLAANERSKVLWRVADLIDADKEAIAALEVRDNGMPIAMARFMVGLGAETFRYFAGWCTKIHGRTAELSSPTAEYHAYTLREPVGVVGLIIPWNVPFTGACNKVAAALAAGCTFVLKPAEETPLTALWLGELLLRAGVPAGAANIVTGLGETAGAALAAHADVDKIAFTGSTEVGKKLLAAAAGNLKRLTLELGGKSPVIVLPDADLEAAAAGAARGVFTNSGQACIAGSRVYVHRSILGDFVGRLKVHAEALRLGDGFAPDTDLGPLISQRQLDRVCRLVDSGLRDKATLITGGHALDCPGYFMTPTVMVDPAPGSEILREEIFGPVITVMGFDDLEQAIADANDTEYGLAAAVWTQDIKFAHRTAKRLRAGTVWLNCQLVTNRMMPFGGYKQSGWGRENGPEGLDAFLETKSVIAAL